MADADHARLAPERRQLTIPLEVSALTVILALALGLMAGGGAALYQRHKPTSYFSLSVLQIDQPVQVSADTGDATLAKLQRLRSYYAGVLDTAVLATPIAHQVNLPVGAVIGSLTTLISPSNFLIDLFAHSPTPQQSQAIAQAASSQLISYVSKQQQKAGVLKLNRVVLREVTQPSLGVKVAASHKKELVSGVVAFVVVAAAFIIVADLLRRRW
jgi:uncharacterized protein involved in exopolysaccharide biosynthesis